MSASLRSSSSRPRAHAVLGLVLTGIAAASVASAQTKVGTSFGSFLLIEPGARIAAQGNAGVTIADGLDGIYFNPAAIAKTTRWGGYFSHAAWFADIAYNYVATGVPLGRWGNVYGSVTALNSGAIDVRTVSEPLGTGEQFTVSDVAVALGYGREITDRFAMGAQLTYVQETVWHSSAQTVVIGIGTLYQVSDQGLRIGASLSNFGTETAFSGRDLRVAFDADPNRFGDNGALPAEQFTGDYPVPALFRVGLGLPVRLDADHELRLAVDAAHPSDNVESVSAGAELKYRHTLALRWGYQNAFQKDSDVGLTTGVGIEGDASSRHYQFDYAWADHGRLGNVHRFSLTLLF